MSIKLMAFEAASNLTFVPYLSQWWPYSSAFELEEQLLHINVNTLPCDPCLYIVHLRRVRKTATAHLFGIQTDICDPSNQNQSGSASQKTVPPSAGAIKQCEPHRTTNPSDSNNTQNTNPDASPAEFEHLVASTPVPFSAFHPFPRLAPELRLITWKASRPEVRAIRIPNERGGVETCFEVYSKAKILGMLHACSESREVALQWYELSFGFAPLGQKEAHIYFDHSRDWLYPSHDWYGQALGALDLKEASKRGSIVKRIMFEFKFALATATFFSLMTHLWFMYPYAREIVLVERNVGPDSRAEASLSLFKSVKTVDRAYGDEIQWYVDYPTLWSSYPFPKKVDVLGDSIVQPSFWDRFLRWSST
ncbi:hypothetical protein BDZ45DRAFT_748203 [Acephala macrosclerotiorum]|nr:hypothetical protein BDZ45DRAFT_748203 [Acephala macrosclerotiorum]